MATERISDIIAHQLDVDVEKVIDSATFIELGADSIDSMELMMAFEDEFGCEIPDEIAATILTVGDAKIYLAKVAEGSPGGTKRR